jgi:hypothetical protein
MDQIVMLAVWPVIGLIAWWASGPEDRHRRGRLVLSLLLGPFMLVPLAWGFIVAADRARQR